MRTATSDASCLIDIAKGGVLEAVFFFFHYPKFRVIVFS